MNDWASDLSASMDRDRRSALRRIGIARTERGAAHRESDPEEARVILEMAALEERGDPKTRPRDGLGGGCDPVQHKDMHHDRT